MPGITSNASPLRVLELYCGIGGCAAAVANTGLVVAAIDVNRHALAVYAATHPHPVVAATVESRSAEELARFGADLWWLSPPCQPFTRRGLGRGLDDPRATTLLVALDRIDRVRPPYVALENVPGIAGSRAEVEILGRLEGAGYEVAARLLCPTELGVPNRRRRYYLVAARGGLAPAAQRSNPRRRLGEFLDADPDPGLTVDPALLVRYAGAVDLVDPEDPEATAATFTSAYGRSPVRSGSYLRIPDGSYRRFSPEEIGRLLGFEGLAWPTALDRRQRWRLLGNSLSVPAVREVLRRIPALAAA